MTQYLSSTLVHDLLAMLLAVIVGGLVGMEREVRDKAAGLRTMIFICLGATLFTLLSGHMHAADSVRIAAQIVTGVGFLGAGVIMRHGSRISGVTTAAVIWVVAALGMAIGAGYAGLALFGTLLVVAVSWSFRRLTRLIDNVHEERNYTIGMKDAFDIPGIDRQLAERGLVCRFRSFGRDQEGVNCQMLLIGKADSHRKLVEDLLGDARITLLTY